MMSDESETEIEELEIHLTRVTYLAYLIAAIINVSWLALAWDTALTSPNLTVAFANTDVTFTVSNRRTAAIQTLLSAMLWGAIIYSEVYGDE